LPPEQENDRFDCARAPPLRRCVIERMGRRSDSQEKHSRQSFNSTFSRLKKVPSKARMVPSGVAALFYRPAHPRHRLALHMLARRNAAHPRRLRARIDSHIIGAPLLMAPTTAPAYGDHSYVLPVHLDDRLNTVPEPRLNRVCAWIRPQTARQAKPRRH
jgi:hypothetical protein